MKSSKAICKVITCLLVVAMLLGMFASCGGKTTETGTEKPSESSTETPTEADTETDTSAPSEAGTINISCDKSQLKLGESATLTVTVTGASDSGYEFTVDSDLITVDETNDTVTVVKEPTIDTVVHVTATLKADKNVKATKTFIVKAPVKEGQVGELTSVMLAELGNVSITASGLLTDFYHDYKDSRNNTEKKYDFSVQMNDGFWASSWNIHSESGKKTQKLTSFYQRGSVDGLTDQNGNTGHALEQLFINLHNEVDSKTVKDYLSIPAIWEAQHLWNHLGSLDINKFTYDAEHGYYKYTIDPTNVDDLYLMTYLSYSLTPLLSDTLMNLYLVVEDGKITKLVGQTEVLLYGDNTKEDPEGDSYTTIEVTFSDIGTTEVSKPKTYDAPEYAELLKMALENMKGALNYTFSAVETTTYAPSGDSGDYDIESVSASKPIYALLALSSFAPKTSATGTEGWIGQVTENAILIADTMKYTYSMDGKNYRTDYYGYKSNGDGSYDQFQWTNDDGGHMYGTKKVNSELSTLLPSFDFSANLFRFEYVKRNDDDVRIYYFTLRETAITRDIALQSSLHDNAPNAEASGSQPLTIAVDENGNLVSVTFPYDISGIYMGYVTTTYSKIGTTKLDENLFDGYVQRVMKTDWSQYDVKYYHPNHTSLTPAEEATADVVLRNIFGDSYKDLPAPDALLEVFGDNLNGPFFDWKEIGTDADGNPIYTDYLTINTTSQNYDENKQITDYEEIISAIKEALVNKYGFEISAANTDMTGGESGRSNRYITFIKGDVQIVIENNFTKYFWIYIYETGAWSLSR